METVEGFSVGVQRRMEADSDGDMSVVDIGLRLSRRI